MIKDSGNRTEFSTGAVRDIQEGKGRCDLLPLDVVAQYTEHFSVLGGVFEKIDSFVKTQDIISLYEALEIFMSEREWDFPTMLLEVSKHFEEGAKKYQPDNWKKGIPLRRYVDSSCRHYLKWLRGDDDEPHDRAFCWNILCCAWTLENKPEMNDLF